MQNLKISSPNLSEELFTLNIIGSAITPKQVAELYKDKLGLTQDTKISKITHRKTGKELDQNEPLSNQGIKNLDEITIDFVRTAGGRISGYKAKRRDKKNLYNLTLMVEYTGRRIPVSIVSADMTIRELMSELAKRLRIKMPKNFDFVRYYTGQYVHPEQTLEESGIGDDEILIVDFQYPIQETIQLGRIDVFKEDIETIRLISDNTIRCYFPAPNLLTTHEYIELTKSKLESLEFVYLVLAIFFTGSSSQITNFLGRIRNRTNSRPLTLSALARLTGPIEPLRITSSQYGSPVSFDLLGLGKVFELIRDIFKDMSWRGKHEVNMANHDENMARLNLKHREAEINQSRLELERTALELQIKKVEIEKASLEILEKKMELLEKASNLNLSDYDKQKIAAILVPKILLIESSSSD